VGGKLDCSSNQLTKIPETYSRFSNLYVFGNLNWNDIKWINKILGDELTAEEVFAIDNIEHRRVAFEHMDKLKMKELKDFKVLDEKVDSCGNPMKIVSFTIQKMKEPLLFYNCFCPSTKREFFLQTKYKTCEEAKMKSFGLDAKEVEFIKEW
jgi:hypothetical protein